MVVNFTIISYFNISSKNVYIATVFVTMFNLFVCTLDIIT
jgi:hypothetical protein